MKCLIHHRTDGRNSIRASRLPVLIYSTYFSELLLNRGFVAHFPSLNKLRISFNQVQVVTKLYHF